MTDTALSASAKTSPEHAAVEAAVAAFATATETRNTADIKAILHANYRAIVNDFSAPRGLYGFVFEECNEHSTNQHAMQFHQLFHLD